MSTNRRLIKYILYIHKWKTMQLLKKNEVNPQYPKSGTLGSQANNVGRYKPGRARGRLVWSKPREGSLPCNVFAWRPHQWLEEIQHFDPQVGYKQEPSQSGLCRRVGGQGNCLAPPVSHFQLVELFTSQLGPNPWWHPGRWDLRLALWCFVRVPKWRVYEVQEEHWPREKEGAYWGNFKRYMKIFIPIHIPPGYKAWKCRHYFIMYYVWISYLFTKNSLCFLM